jgi:hypothetical protein
LRTVHAALIAALAARESEPQEAVMRMPQMVFAAAIMSIATGAWAGDRPTAVELLTACQNSFEKLSRVRMECTETMAEPKQPAAGIPSEVRESTLLRDGVRWKVNEIRHGTRQVAGKSLQFGFWSQTLIGDDIIEAQLFNLPPQDPQQRPIVMAFRDDHSRRVWSKLSLARVLFGHMEGDSGFPLWTVMGEDTVLELLPEPEKIAGIETWVLKSRGKYGEHKVWFDPANGGLPRRIEIHKQLGNMFNDEQLGSRPAENAAPTKPQRGRPAPPSALEDVFTRTDNIQIEKKNGLFVITAFDFENRIKLVKPQREIERRRELRVREIDVDLKSWPEDAFQFDIKIPNEHRVGICVNAPLEFGAAVADTYEDWVDGKLRKRLGQ